MDFLWNRLIYNKFKETLAHETGHAIDLMKYAAESLINIPDGYTRMIANEQDVKGLLILSGISKKWKN